MLSKGRHQTATGPLARRALDVFDDLLAWAPSGSSCLSHVPLLGGYDEPETFS